MSHDDHAVENNPRKELLYVGLFALMLSAIIGLIFYGGYMRPAAPSVETLLSQMAESSQEQPQPVDASAATPAEMVAEATDSTPVAPADAAIEPVEATAIAEAAAEPTASDIQEESREVSTSEPVLDGGN